MEFYLISATTGLAPTYHKVYISLQKYWYELSEQGMLVASWEGGGGQFNVISYQHA